MAQKLLKAVMVAIFAAAQLSFPLIVALYAGTPAFPDKALLTGFFALAGLEKIWTQFFRARQRNSLAGDQDWTAAAVGAAYTILMYAVLMECYLKRTGITIPLLAWGGLLAYVAALGLQYAAFFYLKHQWAVHLDKPFPDRSLIQSGPYRYMRHPLYLAYCLEALGITLVMQAFWSFGFGLLVFVPLEIKRAYYEERFLRETFGAGYRDYATRVRAFFPLPFRKKTPNSG